MTIDGIVVVTFILIIGLLIMSFCLWQNRRKIALLEEKALNLQKSNAVKDQLFSIIGHDLIGYVSSMSMGLELCRDEKTTLAEKDYLLSQLERNATASFETLQNLLKWGKSKIQGIVIRQVKFDAYEIALETLPLVKISAETKQIAIVNNIPAGTWIYADLNHFRFIMRNLLSNAIKYTRNNGQIEISAKRSIEDDSTIFSVKDEGIGLSDNKKAEIFDSFGISSPGTANEKGYGIGLRLCKEFVVENGGAIWVESIPNEGATFYFSMKNDEKRK